VTDVRIFLDANILFSAAKSDGAIRALVERLLVAGHECWVDAYVIDEARRNVLAKQPNRVAPFLKRTDPCSPLRSCSAATFS